jgi:hypothetical protein
MRILLTGPAKIGPDWHREGDVAEVDDGTAADLAAAGVAQPAAAADLPPGEELLTFTRDEFDRAVAQAAQAVAMAVLDETVTAAVTPILAERDEALRAAAVAREERDAARVRIAELETAPASALPPAAASEAAATPKATKKGPAVPKG